MKPESHFKAGHERVRHSAGGMPKAEPERIRKPEVPKADRFEEPKVPRAPKPPQETKPPQPPRAPKQRGGGVPRQLHGKIALPPGEQAYIPSDVEYP